MSNFTLERSLHVLGPVFGRKHGVEVLIGGGQACTDGNTVHLPSLPPEDREAAVLGLGYLFHETNHIRRTDFSVEKGEGLVGALTNALEDIRVDGLGHAEYAGGHQVEEQLVEAMLRRNEARRPHAGDHPARVLENYVMWRLEHDVLGIETAREIALESETLFREVFPPGTATKLDGLMFTVRDCDSTAAVSALAQRIAAMLAAEANDEEKKPGAGQAPPPGHNGGNVPPAAPSPMRQALEAGADDHAQDLGQMVAQALDAKARDADPNASIAMPTGVSFEPAKQKKGRNMTFQFDVRSATNALRQRTAGLLQSESFCRRLPAMSGRRLDAKRMYRARNGDGRIFRRVEEGITTDTAIQVLVDRSGSTSGGVIEIAREACYAIGLAMQNVEGVTTAIAAFPGEQEDQLIRLSAFGERIERYAERFAALEAGGGTPMAEAMLWGAAELLGQDKPRRLLLLVTDGAYQPQRCRRMLDALDAVGIEVLGIGINFDVAHLFPLHRTIDSVDRLAQAMFDLLMEALRSRNKDH
jgi:Mg-chelatase subunit ChlD